MAVTPQGIEARVRTLAQELIARAGYELVDLEYRREPGGWTLRLFIDKPGGVTLGDCEQVSREFGTVLEVEDPIPHTFHLEVSSPGLDRPLTREGDFLAAEGKLVRIVVREPINGQRNFSGRLIDVRQSDPAGTPGMVLQIRDETGADHLIPRESIARARSIHEWPEPAGRGHGKQARKPGSTPGRNPGRNQ